MTVKLCEYFGRYTGIRGECFDAATLALVGRVHNGDIVHGDAMEPPILVCRAHAGCIVDTFPELGNVDQRFVMVQHG